MTTGLHDRQKCHSCMCDSQTNLSMDECKITPPPSSIGEKKLICNTQQKTLVAFINSVFLTHRMTCQKARFYNIAGITRCRASRIVSAPGDGFNFGLFKMSRVISCQIHSLWHYEDKRSCYHHPLASLLRRRRDCSRISAILWLHGKRWEGKDLNAWKISIFTADFNSVKRTHAIDEKGGGGKTVFSLQRWHVMIVPLYPDH